MFVQLKELDLIQFTNPNVSGLDGEFELNLPMLASIQLEQVKGIEQLTLDARDWRESNYWSVLSLKLKLVHADSVEWLATDSLEHLLVKNLKSLKYLHCSHNSEIDATLLSGLKQPKEVHTQNRVHVSELFKQKQRFSQNPRSMSWADSPI